MASWKRTNYTVSNFPFHGDLTVPDSIPPKGARQVSDVGWEITLTGFMLVIFCSQIKQADNEAQMEMF